MAPLPPRTETNRARATRRARRARSALLAALLLAPVAPISMGAPGGGIGGTGITGFGPIQRFGSIFVNGREYFLGPDTRYTVDGRSAGRAALHVGDTVVVRGTGDPSRSAARARLVEVRHALVGPVDAVAADGTQLTVFGQRVRIPQGVAVVGAHGAAALRVGDWVAVSGLADGHGGWVTTRVAVRYRAGAVPAGARAVLQGGVSAAGAGSLRIGAQAVRLAPGARPAPARGSRVRVVGRYRDGTIDASRIGPARLSLGGPGRYVEMEGYPVHGARGGLRSNGVALRGAGAPPGPARAELHADRPLLFRGRIGPDGGLELEQVTPPRPARAPRVEREGDTDARRPRSEVENPQVERPEVERPEIERPEVERPVLPEIELPDR